MNSYTYARTLYLLTLRLLKRRYDRFSAAPFIYGPLYIFTLFFTSFLYASYARYFGDTFIGWWLDLLYLDLDKFSEIRLGTWPEGSHTELKERVLCEQRCGYISTPLKYRLYAVALLEVLWYPFDTLLLNKLDALLDKLCAISPFSNTIDLIEPYFPKITALLKWLLNSFGPSLTLVWVVLHLSVFLSTLIIHVSAVFSRGRAGWNRKIYNRSGVALFVSISCGLWLLDLPSAWLLPLTSFWLYFIGYTHPVYHKTFQHACAYVIAALCGHLYLEFMEDAGACWITINLYSLALWGEVDASTMPVGLSLELQALVRSGEYLSVRGYYLTLLYTVSAILATPLELIKSACGYSLLSLLTPFKQYIDSSSYELLQPLSAFAKYLMCVEVPTLLLSLACFVCFLTVEGLRNLPKISYPNTPYTRLQFLKDVMTVVLYSICFYFIGHFAAIPLAWFMHWGIIYVTTKSSGVRYPRAASLGVVSLACIYWFLIWADPLSDWVLSTLSSDFYHHGYVDLHNWPNAIDQDLKYRAEVEQAKGSLPMWLRRQIIVHTLIYLCLIPLITVGAYFTPNIYYLLHVWSVFMMIEPLISEVPFFRWAAWVATYIIPYTTFPGFIVLLVIVVCLWFERGMVLLPRYGIGNQGTIFILTFLLLCLLLLHVVHSMQFLAGTAYWALFLANCVLWFGFYLYLMTFR